MQRHERPSDSFPRRAFKIKPEQCCQCGIIININDSSNFEELICGHFLCIDCCALMFQPGTLETTCPVGCIDTPKRNNTDNISDTFSYDNLLNAVPLGSQTNPFEVDDNRSPKKEDIIMNEIESDDDEVEFLKEEPNFYRNKEMESKRIEKTRNNIPSSSPVTTSKTTDSYRSSIPTQSPTSPVERSNPSTPTPIPTPTPILDFESSKEILKPNSTPSTPTPLPTPNLKPNPTPSTPTPMPSSYLDFKSPKAIFQSQNNEPLVLDIIEPPNKTEKNECGRCKRNDKLKYNCTVICAQCKIFLCEDCTEAHSKEPLFSEHEITSTVPDEIQCASHTSRDCTLFCVKCKKPICSLCKCNEMDGHKTEPIIEHLFREKKEFVKSIVGEYNLKDLEKEIKEIDIKIKDCEKTISTASVWLTIASKEKELLEDISRKFLDESVTEINSVNDILKLKESASVFVDQHVVFFFLFLDEVRFSVLQFGDSISWPVQIIKEQIKEDLGIIIPNTGNEVELTVGLNKLKWKQHFNLTQKNRKIAYFDERGNFGFAQVRKGEWDHKSYVAGINCMWDKM